MPKPYYVVTLEGLVWHYRTYARASGISGIMPGSLVVEGDDEASLPLGTLVTLLRRATPGQPIPDTREAILPVAKGVLAQLATPGERPMPTQRADVYTTKSTGAMMGIKKNVRKKGASKAGAKSAKTASTSAQAKRGRPAGGGKFAGYRIIKLERANPRREGTSGYNSWNAISKSGMLYEDYLAAGGVKRDLMWAVEKGWLKLERAK